MKLLQNEMLIGLLIGVLIGFLFFASRKTEEKMEEERHTVTQIRTVEHQLHITIPTPAKVEPAPIPKGGGLAKFDSLRTYTGREKIPDYGYFEWSAQTGGFLNSLQINPFLLIPETTTTTTTTRTRTNFQTGLWIGGGFSRIGDDVFYPGSLPRYHLHVSMRYQLEKLAVDYQYHHALRMHTVGASIPLHELFR